MISCTIRPEKMETPSAINRNVKSNGIHTYSSKGQKVLFEAALQAEPPAEGGSINIHEEGMHVKEVPNASLHLSGYIYTLYIFRYDTY